MCRIWTVYVKSCTTHACQWEGRITKEQANYLWEKYLFGVDAEEDE